MHTDSSEEQVSCQAVLSVLQGSESDHGPALPEFVEWDDGDYLSSVYLIKSNGRLS